MTGVNIGDEIYRKVSEKIKLIPLSEFDDLKTIVTSDGRKVGKFSAYKGEKLDKFSIAEFSLMPGMDYINVSLKPKTNFNIPRFSVNYMDMAKQKKIQFDVDLYPAVDLAIRQDYVDKYYEPLTEIYLREKNSPSFKWKVSDRSYVRASASPYFFMSAADIADAEKVQSLILAYLDVTIRAFEEENPVSGAEAKEIAYRLDYIIKLMLEREPERKWLEKSFGNKLTERLIQAMI